MLYLLVVNFLHKPDPENHQESSFSLTNLEVSSSESENFVNDSYNPEWSQSIFLKTYLWTRLSM